MYHQKYQVIIQKLRLLTLMDEAHWDDMFAKKHNVYKNPPVADTIDNSFDVSTLS